MNTTYHSKVRLALLGISLLFLPACGPGDGNEEVLVSAAASLSEAFIEMEAAFEESHDELDVIVNLGGSSALREQILEGAPADVFASANRSNMDRVAAAGELSGEPEVFATNAMQVAVPPGNPAEVSGLEDFADPDLLIGLCVEEAPCGDFARRVLAKSGITPDVDTNEPNVRALLTKIETSELDAGITYVTDVASTQGAVEGVEIPDDVNVRAQYLIAGLADAPNPGGAAAFVDFVLSRQGQEILTRYGFGPP